MSSLFVTFCLAKNVTGNDSYITGTALYRINDNTDKFREITFKGFLRNPDSLVTPFEKNTIILMVGCYVCEDNVTIIQSVPISYSDDEYTLTQENLPNSSPLLLYSASIVLNSYIPNNNGGRESFMLARCLYNGVTNNKQIDSKVIISYVNENNRYNSLKNNLKRTVLSVVEQLKLGSKRLPHVLASDIEWTYLTNDPQPSNASSIVSQIQKEASPAGSSHVVSTPQVINEPSTQTADETLNPTTSCTNTSVNNNAPTEPIHSDAPILQGEKLEANRKRLRPLLPAKK
ncbi:2899_t:CDS:2 [Gigaspora margarita]|uniref:2899_t:CDS:1 n=1 Tax=Gigaspora margarita TaxID=4874 RepID=A0ABN7UT23_GIGMA|nr:2899_t:CDS:2 [Gigaspora margarita]